MARSIPEIKTKFDGYRDGFGIDLQRSIENLNFVNMYDEMRSINLERKIRMLNKLKVSCKSLQRGNNKVYNSVESYLYRSLEDDDGFNIKGTKALSNAPGIVKFVGRLILFIIRIIESIISIVVNFLKSVFRLIAKAVLVFRTAGKNALKTPEEYIAKYGDDKKAEIYDISTYNGGLGLTQGLSQILLTCKAVNAAVKYGAGDIYGAAEASIKAASKFPKSYVNPNATENDLLFESIGVKKVIGDPTTILKKVRADRVKELIFDCQKNKNLFHDVIGQLNMTKATLKAFERKSDTKEQDLETIRVVNVNIGKLIKEIVNVSVFSLKLIKFGNDSNAGRSVYGSTHMSTPVNHKTAIKEIKKKSAAEIDEINRNHAEKMNRMNDFFETADVNDPNFQDNVLALFNS